MTHLVPCPGCRRHVRVSETNCPFCSAALSLANTPAPVLPTLRLGRAATFAFGATLLGASALVACSGESEERGGDNGGGKSGASGSSTGGSSNGGSSNGGSSGSSTGGTDNVGGGMALYGGPPLGGSGGSGGTDNTGGIAQPYGVPPDGGIQPPYGIPPDPDGGMP